MEFLTIYKAATVYGGERAWGNGAVYGNRNLRPSLPLPSQRKPASIPLQKHHRGGNTWICASEQKHSGDTESQQASNQKGNQGAAQGTARLPEVVFPPMWMRRDETTCSNLLLWRKAQFYMQTKCSQYSAAKPWLERSQCLLQGDKMFNPLARGGEQLLCCCLCEPHRGLGLPWVHALADFSRWAVALQPHGSLVSSGNSSLCWVLDQNWSTIADSETGCARGRCHKKVFLSL